LIKRLRVFSRSIHTSITTRPIRERASAFPAVILPGTTLRAPVDPLLLLFLQRNISYRVGHCSFVRRKKDHWAGLALDEGYNKIIATLSSLS
jgi:hypothetical protein